MEDDRLRQRLAGSTATLTLYEEIDLGDGRTDQKKHEFRAAALRDVDYAELDEWVQGRVIAAARASLTEDTPEELRRETLDVAIEKALTTGWMTKVGRKLAGTIGGCWQMAYMMCKQHRPNLTPKAMQNIIGNNHRNIEAVWDTFALLQSFGHRDAPPESDEKKSEE